MFIRSMVAEHLAGGCALEGLEAGFALDCEGGGILHSVLSALRIGRARDTKDA